MSAVPETKGPDGKTVRWGHNRLEQIRREGVSHGLSSSLEGSYLLDDLRQMGGTKLLPSVGEVAFDWKDIWYYHLATGRLETRQDRLTMKRISDAYCLGKYEGTSPLSIAPHLREPEEN